MKIDLVLPERFLIEKLVIIAFWLTGTALSAPQAPAADLPITKGAADYVRICSEFGDGFCYIPGSDTCLAINGYVRADLSRRRVINLVCIEA